MEEFVLNSSHVKVLNTACTGLSVDRISLTLVILNLGGYDEAVYRLWNADGSSFADHSYTQVMSDGSLVPSNAVYTPNCTTYIQMYIFDPSRAGVSYFTDMFDSSLRIVKTELPESRLYTLCLWECAEGWLLKNANPYECYTCNYTSVVGYFTNDSTYECLVESCGDYMLNCAQCLNSTVCQACNVGTVVTGGCTESFLCI